MSSSYSKTVEYKGDHYADGAWSPTTKDYKARFHFHHTSDTVTWERTGPNDDKFVQHMIMSGEEYDALHEAVMDGSLEYKQALADLEKFKAGVEAALGTMERNFERAKMACASALEEAKKCRAAIEYPDRDEQLLKKLEDATQFLNIQECRLHDASRMMINVRYAFKNAGLPVATCTGPAKLLEVMEQTAPPSLSQP